MWRENARVVRSNSVSGIHRNVMFLVKKKEARLSSITYFDVKDSSHHSILSPVHNTQNFVCFAKKSVKRKSFLVWTIFFTFQNFLKCHQTSKEKFWRPTIFVRQQNPLFLDSYPLSGYLISQTWPINVPLIEVSGYTKTFPCLRCKQGCKKNILVITKLSIFLHRPNSTFCHSANRAFIIKIRKE